MKSVFRRPMTMLAGAAVAASVLIVPAHGAAEPTTLAIEGKLRVVVIDGLGPGGHDDLLHTVVTDDGAEIPVDLDDDAPANGRFRGEVVVAGKIASALRSKDLLPKAGTTIDEDTRAGRVATAAAEAAPKPLTVASSTIAPAVDVALAPSAHRAYVAKLVDAESSVDGSDDEIEANINAMLDYWETESGGLIADFGVVRFVNPNQPGAVSDAVTDFSSTFDVSPAGSCGMRDPDDVWAEAAGLFPGVNFTAAGNHLIILVGEECVVEGGPTGMADVGSSINDGGISSINYDPKIFETTGVHEIGHNFGLYHANLDGCDCEYFDLYSPMGFSAATMDDVVFGPPALGTLYRSQLGLTAPGEVATVAVASGNLTQSVALAPRAAASGQRGLLVKDPTTGVTYSIDWRSGTGRDAEAFYDSGYAYLEPDPLYPAGIVVERQDGPGATYLISHRAGGRDQGAFRVGETFAPSSGLRVTVGSIGAATATVTVQLTPPALPPAPPAAAKTFSANAPKITGTARVGKTLKVTVGSWSPRPSYRFQWYANGKKITKNGTKSSFKLTSKQKGKRITVRVTGSKPGYVTATKASKATKKVVKR